MKYIKSIKRSVLLVLILLFVLSAGCSNANTVRKLSEVPVDTNNIMTIIKELTSEKYKGRLTGTEGNILAGDYICNYFKNIKLDSPRNIQNYREWYTQKTRLIHSAPELAVVDKSGKDQKKFEYVKEFMVQTSPMTRLKGEAISNLAVIKGSGYLNQDFAGRTILIEERIFNELINSESFTAVLASSNLKGIILGVDTSGRGYFGITPVVLEDGEYIGTNVPFVLNVNMNVYDELSQACENGQQVRISADFSVEEVKVSNIIGIIEGESKDCIIVGAHYDHVGDNMNGTYNPGALDNASGTAAVMEIARILKTYGQMPQKTIVFIAFNGEEQSFYGSKYYAIHPLFPLESSSMINMDTIGSKENLPIQIEGYENSNAQIVKDFCRLAEEEAINFKTGKSDGTDHSSFGEKGVEAVNLIQPDFNNGYHGPEDTADNINAKNIGKVIQLIIDYLSQYAF